MTDNNSQNILKSDTLQNISSKLNIEKDIEKDIKEYINDEDENDNKSVNSNISNLSNKLIIDNISSSIRDIFIQNNSDNSDNSNNLDILINKEPITTLHNTISSWNSIDSTINTKNIIPIISDLKTNNNEIKSFAKLKNFNKNFNKDFNKLIKTNTEEHNNNVTFSIDDISEIKSFAKLNNNNKNNNLENLSSINSGSEVSYTAIANKQLPLDDSMVLKHIRGTKKKQRNKDDNDLDEVDYLYNKLQDYIRYMCINRYNYILIIVKAMEIIDNNTNTNEIDKKTTVTKALNRIVLVDLKLSDFDQSLFLSSLNNIIEIIIICSKINNINKYSSKTIRDNKTNDDSFVLASSGQIIHSLIDKITTIVIKKQYNADKLFVNICTVTDILMILVNKYNYINSIEKKTIVIQAFTIFITEKLEYIINLAKDKKQNLILALDSIPFIIDLFIALQNGKYKINRKAIKLTTKTSFFRRLCCCSKKNNND